MLDLRKRESDRGSTHKSVSFGYSLTVPFKAGVEILQAQETGSRCYGPVLACARVYIREGRLLDSVVGNEERGSIDGVATLSYQRRSSKPLRAL